MGIKFRQQSLLSGKMHISSAAGPDGFALLTDHVLEISVSLFRAPCCEQSEVATNSAIIQF